jgi:hypothetical protein
MDLELCLPSELYEALERRGAHLETLVRDRDESEGLVYVGLDLSPDDVARIQDAALHHGQTFDAFAVRVLAMPQGAGT